MHTNIYYNIQRYRNRGECFIVKRSDPRCPKRTLCGSRKGDICARPRGSNSTATRSRLGSHGTPSTCQRLATYNKPRRRPPLSPFLPAATAPPVYGLCSILYLLATTYDLRFPPRYYSHLTSFICSLHMLAAISPSAHDLSQSMPYSHTRTTSHSALPDLGSPAETKICPGCQQTVMDENGGVVIAFGWALLFLLVLCYFSTASSNPLPLDPLLTI